MFREKIMRIVAGTLAIILAFTISFQPGGIKIQRAKAGNIANPTWSISDLSENASDVTYTLSFVTQTAIPSCFGGGSCGGFEISMGGGPGNSQFPDFSNTKVTVERGGTTYVSERSLQGWELMSGQGWLGLNIMNGPTAIPAGEITITFIDVVNPAVGGSLSTNVLTANQGNVLDGGRNTSNSTIAIGSESVRGRILSAATGEGVANLRVEIHGMYAGSGFWQTNTNSTGDYSFRGVTPGQYYFEMSPGTDMQNRSLSQYLRFDPMSIVIAEEETLEIDDIMLEVSSKEITGIVKYSDDSGVVVGAMVNAFSMGKGGSSFSQSGPDGRFTLRVGSGSTYYVMVNPAFGPPPGEGQGNEPRPADDFFPQSPKAISFIKGPAVAETLNLGEVLVDRADAIVTGRLKTPSGDPVVGGGMGANNFQSHTHVPIMLQQDGTFSFKAKSNSGLWRLERFDPSGSFTMPDTEFKIKSGTNNLGTITMTELGEKITVTAKRQDNDSVVPNIPIMAFNLNKQGPPYMAFTDSDGVAEIKVPEGFKGRVMANPGGEGGPGKRGPGGEGEGPGGPGEGPGGPGEGPGGPGEPMGLFFEMVKHAIAAEEQVESEEGHINASQLYPLTPPQKVKAGDSVTLEFGIADKLVNISTLKADTNQLMTDGGFVEAIPANADFESFGKGFGGPTAGGQGSLYVTAGEYEFQVFYPPESDWIGVSKRVNVTESGQSVQLQTLQKTVTVTGSVLDASDDNAVIKDSSLEIMIGIFGEGGFSMGMYDPETGTYTAKFAPGMKFRIGVAAGDPGIGIRNGGYIPNINPIELEGEDGQTITQNVTLAKVDATITGKIVDQNGDAVEGVTVFADPGLAKIIDEGPGHGREEETGPEFGFSATTNEDGEYSINVAPNNYNLIVNAKDQGLFSVETNRVEIGSGETKTANISLARADSKLIIEVNDQDGNNLEDAEVQIFNERGTIAFGTDVDSSGVVEIEIPADTYTIKAGKDSPESGTVEESDFIKVVVQNGQTVREVLTTDTLSGVLPRPVTTEVDSSSPASLALQRQGAEVAPLNIPTGALTSSSSMGSSGEEDEQSASGNPMLTVNPLDAQTVTTKADLPIRGISVEAIDSNGNEITTLAGMVTGSIVYSEDELPPGVLEANLKIKSFNVNSGQWEEVATSVVDTDNNSVTFATTHFSDFAIVAAADTTSPSAPTNVTATGGDGKVTLSWVNPSDGDLAGIKVFRSSTSGTVGELVTTISNTSTTSFENTGLTNGTPYYYVVRSYDSSGNISTNTTQVTATPGVLPVTGPSNLGIWDTIIDFFRNIF